MLERRRSSKRGLLRKWPKLKRKEELLLLRSKSKNLLNLLKKRELLKKSEKLKKNANVRSAKKRRKDRLS